MVLKLLEWSSFLFFVKTEHLSHANCLFIHKILLIRELTLSLRRNVQSDWTGLRTKLFA